MKKETHLILLLIAFMWTLNSCKKDVPTDNDNQNTTTPTIKWENERLSKRIPTTQTTVFLNVMVEDEEGKSIPGVKITAGDQSMLTDQNGNCFFSNISINKDFAMVIAQKNGYFKGIRTFPVTDGAYNTASITLMRKGNPLEFSAKEGGMMSFENNTIKVTFPPNAIVDAMGKPYYEKVQIFTRYIDPQSDHFSSIMPGTLVGLTENNTLAGMISYGMLNVELSDFSGNPLQLAEGSFATISMPAIFDAPEVMPYWHFNEKYGVWVQAGNTRKKENTYEFEAYSFSAWNLDIIVDDGEEDVIVDMEDEKKIGLPNRKVQVFSDGNFTHKSVVVHTDENGRFRVLLVPRQLGFRLFGRCENIDKTSTVTAPMITVQMPLSNKTQMYTIRGMLNDCDNIPLSNAHFFLQSIEANPPIQFIGKTDMQGTFNVTEMVCDIDPLKSQKMIAQVFGQGNTFKRDTLEIRFTGSSKERNIDFCKTNQQGDTYPTGTVHCSPTPTAIVEIVSPTTGKVWMDRNLGALGVATTSNDTQAFGDLYQWGRRADGHQCRNSRNITTLSITDNPTHGDFITTLDQPNDWRTTQNDNLWQGISGINNPCPSGFRVPTEIEFDMEVNAWESKDEKGAFESILKLTMAGGRNSTNGAISAPGSLGRYWTSSPFESGARTLALESSRASWLNAVRGTGRSVRCIKN